MVLAGSINRRSMARLPTTTPPEGRNDTLDGMRRVPSGPGMVKATPSRTVATTVFVVPKSIPTALAT
jgi:hypothetical protein